jgi:hypothetical protein
MAVKCGELLFFMGTKNSRLASISIQLAADGRCVNSYVEGVVPIAKHLHFSKNLADIKLFADC